MSDTDSLFKRFLFGEATEQQVFDEVRTKLVAQGKRSYEIDENGRDSCVYTAPDGSHCAIGMILSPVELERVDSENWNMGVGGGQLACEMYNRMRNSKDTFLDAIQACHDSAHASAVYFGSTVCPNGGPYPDFITGFEANMRILAEQYGLVME